MLLAIDVGNTQTHVGAFDGEKLIAHWRFMTQPGATADQLAVRVGSLLGLRELQLGQVDGAVVSSVVPRLSPEYEEMCESYLSSTCVMVGPGVKTGMAIRIDNPHEVGADRLVNAVAAYDHVGRACVVVDFGTAITSDAVSAEGDYLGGVIGPGIEISLEALTERAAKLPKVDLVEPESVIGKSTQQALQ